MATEPGEPVRLVLLPSPLLGPAVWAPVGLELARRGWDVVLPPPYDAVSGPDDVLAQLLRAVPTDGPVVLVPHSNAGLYAAAVAAERDVRGIVFVDARLPGEHASAAEPEFRAFLATVADEDGRLPVWTRWWDAADMEGLFPDDAARAAVEAEELRLPLGYFDGEVPSPAGWTGLPAAYLAFGDTYGTELAEAQVRGWPVMRLEGRHLHQLTDPAGVALALEGLLGPLGFRLRPGVR